MLKAWPIVSDMLNEEPENPRALYFAGWVMRHQGHTGVALQLFRRALALESKVPNIWMHYAACLHDTHKYDDAREAFKLVHKAMPKDPMPLANIAAGYVQQGKSEEAVAWADRALAIDPENRIARIAKGFACLGLGRWAEGWEHAAYLYGDKLIIRVYRDPEEPTWDGTPGQTVVVQADQGLGDMLMFSQCIPDLAKDCKQVIVETNTRLAPLFKRNFPQVHVYDTLKQKGGLEWPKQYEIDAHIHISWLGKFYRKADSEFPRKPYLEACPEKRAKWRTWLQQWRKPWVGLAWKGGIPHTNMQARSMELQEWEPILKQGGSLISLCYQDVAGEIARWNIDNREQVHVPPIDNAGDYDEWFALLAELDQVICTTTTVAHARGAMGKSAYVMVNHAPAWRYLHGTEDGLIWYPPHALSLYRQKLSEKNWAPTIARVAADYKRFLSLNMVRCPHCAQGHPCACGAQR